jgi:hypothetical protein
VLALALASVPVQGPVRGPQPAAAKTIAQVPKN